MNKIGVVESFEKEKILKFLPLCYTLSDRNSILKAVNRDNHLQFLVSDGKSILSFNPGVEIDFPISLTFPSKRFFDLVRTVVDNAINITFFKDSVEIRSGNFFCHIPSLQDEPLLDPYKEYSNMDFFDFFGDLFLYSMSKLSSLIPQGLSDYGYPGVFVNSFGEFLEIVVTDGFRLGCIRAEKGFNREIGFGISKKNIPMIKALCEFSKKENVSLRFSKGDGFIVFRANDLFFVIPLLLEEFPDYRDLFNRQFVHKIVLDGNLFKNMIKRLSLFVETQDPITLDFSSGNMTISAKSKIFGEASESANLKDLDCELTLSFSSRLLLDLLKNFDKREIYLYVSNDKDLCLFKPKDRDNEFYFMVTLEEE